MYLLQNDERRRGRRRIRNRDTASSQSNMVQLQPQDSSNSVGANQVRNAMKQLNRDWHNRNRSMSNSGITAHQIVHHEDSD